MIVLPIAYFPPIPWYSAISGEEAVLLEVYQHYRKQKYTNRMYIRSANRVLPLSIPVERRGMRMPIKEKKISYQDDWQKQHWQSLISAYRNSPYFLYYEDELSSLYKQKPVYLLDFLESCLGFIQDKMKLDTQFKLTAEYFPTESYADKDFRDAFDSGRQELPAWFTSLPYPQVFEGFESGLSILDLLFNMGPEGNRLILDGKANLY